MGHLPDEFVGMSYLGSTADSLGVSAIDPEGDVVEDRGIEEDRLLVDIAHEPA